MWGSLGSRNWFPTFLLHKIVSWSKKREYSLCSMSGKFAKRNELRKNVIFNFLSTNVTNVKYQMLFMFCCWCYGGGGGGVRKAPHWILMLFTDTDKYCQRADVLLFIQTCSLFLLHFILIQSLAPEKSILKWCPQ